MALFSFIYGLKALFEEKSGIEAKPLLTVEEFTAGCAYETPPNLEKWLQHAIDNDWSPDYINQMVTDQQAMLHREAEEIAKYGATEGYEYALAKAFEEREAGQGLEDLDEFGNRPSDYTNTGSPNDTYYAQSIGWRLPILD